jgi:hypothetical protein
MWFFVPLTVIYLSIPFISLFVVNANRRVLKQFILLAVAFNFVGAVYSAIVPSNGGSGTLLNIYIFGSRFLIFLVAGYYIGNFEISKSARNKLYVLALFSLAVIAIGTAFLQLNIPSKYNILIGYTNLPCTLLAFAVFCWFKYIDWNQVCGKLHINSNSLAKFSGLSLGIYLIQRFWFIFIGQFCFIPQQGFTCFVIMYVLCIASVWLIKKLPILKHTV